MCIRDRYQNRGVPSSIRWTSELEVVDTDPSEVKVFEGDVYKRQA